MEITAKPGRTADEFDGFAFAGWRRAFPDANLTALALDQQVPGATHRPHLHGDIAARRLLRLQAAVHGADGFGYQAAQVLVVGPQQIADQHLGGLLSLNGADVTLATAGLLSDRGGLLALQGAAGHHAALALVLGFGAGGHA